MSYYQKNYNEMIDILELNFGIIISKHIDNLFNAFQISSGETYFNSKLNAIIDYFNKNQSLIIQYPSKQIEIKSLNELELYFQKYDGEFNLSIFNNKKIIEKLDSESILKIGNWINQELLEFNIYSTIFKKNIDIQISFDNDEEKKISDLTIITIQDIQNLSNIEIEIINDEIWKNCLDCNQTTSYLNNEKEVESKLEDNLLKYGIKNKADAMKKSSFKNIFIANNWGVEERIFKLEFDLDWDKEHNLSISYENGKYDYTE